MTRPFLDIYNSIGAVAYAVFMFAMIVYVLFNLSQILARMLERRQPDHRTQEQIDNDINEQW